MAVLSTITNIKSEATYPVDTTYPVVTTEKSDGVGNSGVALRNADRAHFDEDDIDDDHTLR